MKPPNPISSIRDHSFGGGRRYLRLASLPGFLRSFSTHLYPPLPASLSLSHACHPQRQFLRLPVAGERPAVKLRFLGLALILVSTCGSHAAVLIGRGTTVRATGVTAAGTIQPKSASAAVTWRSLVVADGASHSAGPLTEPKFTVGSLGYATGLTCAGITDEIDGLNPGSHAGTLGTATSTAVSSWVFWQELSFSYELVANGFAKTPNGSWFSIVSFADPFGITRGDLDSIGILEDTASFSQIIGIDALELGNEPISINAWFENSTSTFPSLSILLGRDQTGKPTVNVSCAPMVTLFHLPDDPAADPELPANIMSLDDLASYISADIQDGQFNSPLLLAVKAADVPIPTQEFADGELLKFHLNGQVADSGVAVPEGRTLLLAGMGVIILARTRRRQIVNQSGAR